MRGQGASSLLNGGQEVLERDWRKEHGKLVRLTWSSASSVKDDCALVCSMGLLLNLEAATTRTEEEDWKGKSFSEDKEKTETIGSGVAEQ